MKRAIAIVFPFMILAGSTLATAGETQHEVAERISHDAERADNRGDRAGKEAADKAAHEAREAPSAEKARQIEKDYNSGKR